MEKGKDIDIGACMASVGNEKARLVLCRVVHRYYWRVGSQMLRCIFRKHRLRTPYQ